MPENDKNSQDIEKEEEVSTANSDEVISEEKEEETPKTKFTFKCTRDDKCCLERGPIPITFWDLELWARNGVIANFLPYLDVYNKPNGTVDLILKPIPPKPEEGEEDAQKSPFETPSIDELLEVKCPLYNKDDKKCLVYEHRPLSCRVYPLEFDGKNFSIVDVDCPGIGEEGMTKEELKEMRDSAKMMYYELTRMRIALPVLNQVLSQKIMMDLMRQNLEVMSKISDEDREKLDEIFKKTKPEPTE
ncbi:MAG: YkgJ family cysteine cluster protein [Candidatus Heimdallarchaeota archaeon]